MRELTLRQIEVVRAVMMAGNIQGAARLLGVSAPGISRLVRHTEDMLGLKLFERRAGLFVPSSEARPVFDVIHQVNHQVANLQAAIGALRVGADAALCLAASPSLAQVVAPRAVHRVRARFPDLFVDLNILKIEETLDYLLLERGEFVLMSSAIENAALESTPIATGRILVIVPEGHALAARAEISVSVLVTEPLIGVAPTDPYGASLARPFVEAGLAPRYALRGRFPQTIISLVRHGLGVALIDEFSIAEAEIPGIARLVLKESASITAHVVTKRGRQLSSFAAFAIQAARQEFEEITLHAPWRRRCPHP